VTATPDCPAICHFNAASAAMAASFKEVTAAWELLTDAAFAARDLGYATVTGMISTWLPIYQRTAPDIDALDLHDLHALNDDIGVLAQLEAAIGRDLSDHAPWLAIWIDAAPALAKRADATRHLLPDGVPAQSETEDPTP
jgi:hypothetical protein